MLLGVMRFRSFSSCRCAAEARTGRLLTLLHQAPEGGMGSQPHHYCQVRSMVLPVHVVKKVWEAYRLPS